MNALARLLNRSREPLGPWGERRAARHLRRSRYRVLARNVRSKLGEIDLVCLAPDRRTLVIVEVKARAARASEAAPRPEDQITKSKRERLLRLAQVEAKRRSMERAPLRIDVVAIERREGGSADLRHHEGAVTP